MKSVNLAPVISWLSEDEVSGLYTASYWNDIDAERSKEWWIADGEYKKCLDYLKRSGLLTQWQKIEEFLCSKGRVNLEVADLAAGIGWTSALFSRIHAVSRVHSTEISQHRLCDLYPHAVSMFSGVETKLYRYLGSFYDLGFENHSMDVVFLSQAFHHADQPLLLLAEIDRILKPGGYLIMIGENYISPLRYLRKYISNIIKNKKSITDFYKLFPPDKDTGDHFYRLRDYYLIGVLLRYEVSYKVMGTDSLIIIGTKHQG